MLLRLLRRWFPAAPDPRHPVTEEQAARKRYGGEAWKPWRCAWEIPAMLPGEQAHQCRNRSGHGPSGLYCKRHAERLARLDV